MSTGEAFRIAALAGLTLVLMGCRQDMHDQPKLQPFEANSFFDNRMASRQLPTGTVARGQLRDDTHLWEGKDIEGNLLDGLPMIDGEQMVVTRELLERGQERFEIFCSVCHDSTGGGLGMIVRRGFKQPSPLWEQRLREMPDGYFFDVMTAGYGVMSSYARQVPVADRWAIVAYIRAIQASQASALADLPIEMQDQFHLAVAPTAEPAAEEHH